MKKNKQPKTVKFMLADDIRAENDSKPMLIGFYSDDIVKALIRDEQPDPTDETPITLRSLAILVVFIDCAGTFNSEIALYQPNGNPILEPKKIEGGLKSLPASKAKSSINFIANFAPFIIPEFGIFKFEIKLDEITYPYYFEVSRGLLKK